MKRVDQLNQLIKQRLGKIIQQDLEFGPNVFITITKVTVTPDLMQAKIWVSIMPEQKSLEITKTLNEQKKYTAHLLGQIANIRKIPKLDFLLDTTEKEAEDLEDLLKE